MCDADNNLPKFTGAGHKQTCRYVIVPVMEQKFKKRELVGGIRRRFGEGCHCCKESPGSCMAVWLLGPKVAFETGLLQKLAPGAGWEKHRSGRTKRREQARLICHLNVRTMELM
eukprot:EG_transcript_56661